MDVWRICKEKYADTAFTGIGSDLVSGRWNPVGYPVVYTSENAAVAALETFVHIDAALMPDMVLVHAELDVGEVEYLEEADLPKTWKRTNPPPAALKELGRDWIDRGECVVLMVPSVPAPGGTNILLNPRHPDISKLKILSMEPFRFDQRMFKA